LFVDLYAARESNRLDNQTKVSHILYQVPVCRPTGTYLAEGHIWKMRSVIQLAIKRRTSMCTRYYFITTPSTLRYCYMKKAKPRQKKTKKAQLNSRLTNKISHPREAFSSIHAVSVSLQLISSLSMNLVFSNMFFMMIAGLMVIVAAHDDDISSVSTADMMIII
jgi:hypothetical protein